MKIYQFKSVTSKDEMIMGLAYPATFMIPALIILLILEFGYPKQSITHKATLNTYVMASILGLAFAISTILMTYIKKKLEADFEVIIENKKVTVWSNKKICFIDELEEVGIKENKNILKVTIYGSEDKFVFVGRSKTNPFGFCSENDLVELKRLSEYLFNISKDGNSLETML